MKDTGIVRKIDELGRIVIPVEFRSALGIKKKDELMITVEEGGIMLSKPGNRCIICNSEKALLKIKSKSVCETCVNEMNSI